MARADDYSYDASTAVDQAIDEVVDTTSTPAGPEEPAEAPPDVDVLPEYVPDEPPPPVDALPDHQPGEEPPLEQIQEIPYEEVRPEPIPELARPAEPAPTPELPEFQPEIPYEERPPPLGLPPGGDKSFVDLAAEAGQTISGAARGVLGQLPAAAANVPILPTLGAAATPVAAFAEEAPRQLGETGFVEGFQEAATGKAPTGQVTPGYIAGRAAAGGPLGAVFDLSGRGLQGVLGAVRGGFLEGDAVSGAYAGLIGEKTNDPKQLLVDLASSLEPNDEAIRANAGRDLSDEQVAVYKEQAIKNRQDLVNTLEGPIGDLAGFAVSVGLDPVTWTPFGAIGKTLGIVGPKLEALGQTRQLLNQKLAQEFSQAVADNNIEKIAELQGPLINSGIVKPGGLKQIFGLNKSKESAVAVKGEQVRHAGLYVERLIENDPELLPAADLVAIARGARPASANVLPEAVLATIRDMQPEIVSFVEGGANDLNRFEQAIALARTKNPELDTLLEAAGNNRDIDKAIALIKSYGQTGAELKALQELAKKYDSGIMPTNAMAEAAAARVKRFVGEVKLEPTTALQGFLRELNVVYKQGFLIGNIPYQFNNIFDGVFRSVVFEGIDPSRFFKPSNVAERLGLAPSERAGERLLTAEVRGVEEAPIGQERIPFFGKLVTAWDSLVSGKAERSMNRAVIDQRMEEALANTRSDYLGIYNQLLDKAKAANPGQEPLIEAIRQRIQQRFAQGHEFSLADAKVIERDLRVVGPEAVSVDWHSAPNGTTSNSITNKVKKSLETLHDQIVNKQIAPDKIEAEINKIFDLNTAAAAVNKTVATATHEAKAAVDTIIDNAKPTIFNLHSQMVAAARQSADNPVTARHAIDIMTEVVKTLDEAGQAADSQARKLAREAVDAFTRGDKPLADRLQDLANEVRADFGDLSVDTYKWAIDQITASAKIKVTSASPEAAQAARKIVDDILEAYTKAYNDEIAALKEFREGVKTGARKGLPNDIYDKRKSAIRQKRDKARVDVLEGGRGRLDQFGIVPPGVARRLGPVRLPVGDESFRSAVAQTPAARITDEGLEVNVTRWQNESLPGVEPVRGSVFYSPVSDFSDTYRRSSLGRTDVGGNQQITGTTLLRRPYVQHGVANQTTTLNDILSVAGGGRPGTELGLAAHKFAADVADGTVHLAKSERASVDDLRAIFLSVGLQGEDAKRITDYIDSGASKFEAYSAIMDSAMAESARKAGYDSIVVIELNPDVQARQLVEIIDLRESVYPGTAGEYGLRGQFRQIGQDISSAVQGVDQGSTPFDVTGARLGGITGLGASLAGEIQRGETDESLLTRGARVLGAGALGAAGGGAAARLVGQAIGRGPAITDTLAATFKFGRSHVHGAELKFADELDGALFVIAGQKSKTWRKLLAGAVEELGLSEDEVIALAKEVKFSIISLAKGLPKGTKEFNVPAGVAQQLTPPPSPAADLASRLGPTQRVEQYGPIAPEVVQQAKATSAEITNNAKTQLDTNSQATNDLLTAWRQQALQKLPGAMQALQNPRPAAAALESIFGPIYRATANRLEYITNHADRESKRVLIDYLGGKTDLDRLIGSIVPFSMWQTRNIPYYLDAMVRHPQVAVTAAKYFKEAEEERQRRQLPLSYAGQISIGHPFGSEKEIFINPVSPFFTVAGQGINVVSAYVRYEQAKDLNAKGRMSDEELNAAALNFAQAAGGGLSALPYASLAAQLTGVLPPGESPLPKPAFYKLIQATDAIGDRIGISTRHVKGPEVPGLGEVSPSSVQEGLYRRQGQVPPIEGNQRLQNRVQQILTDDVARGNLTLAEMNRALITTNRDKDYNFQYALSRARQELGEAAIPGAFIPAGLTREVPFAQQLAAQGKEQQAAARKALEQPETIGLERLEAEQALTPSTFFDTPQGQATLAISTQYTRSDLERELRAQQEEYFNIPTDTKGEGSRRQYLLKPENDELRAYFEARSEAGNRGDKLSVQQYIQQEGEAIEQRRARLGKGVAEPAKPGAPTPITATPSAPTAPSQLALKAEADLLLSKARDAYNEPMTDDLRNFADKFFKAGKEGQPELHKDPRYDQWQAARRKQKEFLASDTPEARTMGEYFEFSDRYYGAAQTDEDREKVRAYVKEVTGDTISQRYIKEYAENGGRIPGISAPVGAGPSPRAPTAAPTAPSVTPGAAPYKSPQAQQTARELAVSDLQDAIAKTANKDVSDFTNEFYAANPNATGKQYGEALEKRGLSDAAKTARRAKDKLAISDPLVAAYIEFSDQEARDRKGAGISYDSYAELIKGQTDENKGQRFISWLATKPGGLALLDKAQPAVAPTEATRAQPTARGETRPASTASVTPTTVDLGQGKRAGGPTGKEGELLDRIGQIAKDSGLGDEGARVAQAIAVTEGGLSGAVGDLDGGGSYGPFQFYWQGQLANFAAANGVDLKRAGELAISSPDEAARWALTNYLGQAIKRGMDQGLSGPELATFAQQYGQVSVSPERAGQNYQALFPAGGVTRSDIVSPAKVTPAIEKAATVTPKEQKAAGESLAFALNGSNFASASQQKIALRNELEDELDRTNASLKSVSSIIDEYEAIPDDQKEAKKSWRNAHPDEDKRRLEAYRARDEQLKKSENILALKYSEFSRQFDFMGDESRTALFIDLMQRGALPKSQPAQTFTIGAGGGGGGATSGGGGGSRGGGGGSRANLPPTLRGGGPYIPPTQAPYRRPTTVPFQPPRYTRPTTIKRPTFKSLATALKKK